MAKNLDYENIAMKPEEFLQGLTSMIYKKIILGGTEKESDNYDDMELIVAIYKDSNMKKTKQMMYGSPAGIITALVSGLNMLLEQGILPKDIKEDIEKLMSDITKDKGDE